MSNTTRTEKAIQGFWNGGKWSLEFADFTRQLERELAEAQAQVEKMKDRLLVLAEIEVLLRKSGGTSASPAHDLEQLIKQRDDAKAQVELCVERKLAFAEVAAQALEEAADEGDKLGDADDGIHGLHSAALRRLADEKRKLVR